MAMLNGAGRSAVLALPVGADVPQVPVPAKVLRTPAALISRMRQAPVSAIYRSPELLKAIDIGLRNQAWFKGMPSGAVCGLEVTSTFSVPCAVTSWMKPPEAT